VAKARNAVGETISELGISERAADDVRLCVSEAVSNVVRHAYGSRRGEVEVVVEHENDELDVVVRDAGKGMTKAHREGRLGGYGLKIISKLARDYTIASKPNAGAEVRMTFGLDQARIRGRESTVVV
jgi:anti-sigma regulatory factor (Ser/Thr protein kinase)